MHTEARTHTPHSRIQSLSLSPTSPSFAVVFAFSGGQLLSEFKSLSGV